MTFFRVNGQSSSSDCFCKEGCSPMDMERARVWAQRSTLSHAPVTVLSMLRYQLGT